MECKVEIKKYVPDKGCSKFLCSSAEVFTWDHKVQQFNLSGQESFINFAAEIYTTNFVFMEVEFPWQ